MNNEFQIQSFPLTIFGGNVPEMSATDLPPGASAGNQDCDFQIGAVKTRPGIISALAYGNLAPEAARSGANVVIPNSSCGNAWFTPNNISHNTPGTNATVGVNQSPNILVGFGASTGSTTASGSVASPGTVPVGATISATPNATIALPYGMVAYTNNGGTGNLPNSSNLATSSQGTFFQVGGPGGTPFSYIAVPTATPFSEVVTYPANGGLTSYWASLLQTFAWNPASTMTVAITSVAVTSNVGTCICAYNTFIPGTYVRFSGVATATFLNGNSYVVTAQTATTFSFTIGHANYGPTADSGTATWNPFIQHRPGSSGAFGSGPHTTTFTNPVTNGSTVVLGFFAANAFGDSGHISTVTDNYSNAYTVVQVQNSTGNPNPVVTIAYAQNVTGGAGFIVTANVTSLADGAGFQIIELPGLTSVPGQPGVGICPNSQYLQASNFVPNIPSTAGILGFQVQVNGLETFASATASISNVAVAAGTLTITAANTFVSGQTITFTGLATATFLNNQSVSVLTASATQFTALFNHANYGSTADSGSATVVSGLPPDAVLTITLANPTPTSPTFTFQLPTTAGSATLGTPTTDWGLGSALTPSTLNNPLFGFNIQATTTGGEAINFAISGVELIASTTPNPPESYLYVKTLTQPDETDLTLALDAGGTLWQEEVNLNPGILSRVYVAIEPNTYAKSVTANFREYLALSDLTTGTDMPRQYDGTFLDRVSQCAPGAPPSVTSLSTGYPIATITQPVLFTWPTSGFPYVSWQGLNNGNSNTPGNVGSIWLRNGFSIPSNLKVGDNFILSGMNALPGVSGNPTLNNGGSNPPFWTATYVSQGPGVGSAQSYLALQFVTTLFGAVSGDNHIASGSLQQTTATLTASAQVPNLEVNSTFTVSGASQPGYDGSWTVLATPNGAQLNVTSTQLSGNIATYSFILVTGTAPTVGQYVTVTNTTNGNGIFNVVNAIITSITVNSFAVAIISPNIANQAEAANAVIFGTQFVFDPLIAVGSSTGGSIETSGVIASGPRQCVCLFQTREGDITPASDPVTFTVNSGASSITVSNIPVGPASITARILAFTPAGAEGVAGGFFYYIPIPVTVTDNGQQVTYSSTVVNDNTTTSVILSFPDSVLLASTEIDIQGQNYFQTIELGASLGVIDYSNRLFWWGEQNKVQNFTNVSFNGGAGVISPNATVDPTEANATYPLGWTVDSSVPYYGSVIPSITYGNSYEVNNTSGGTLAVVGRIEQNAATDAYGVHIIQDNTTYSVRLAAYSPSAATAGSIVIDLFQPSTNSVKGSYTLPLSSLETTTGLFSGTLLTTVISSQPGSPVVVTPPPAPQVYNPVVVQAGSGSTYNAQNGSRFPNDIIFEFPNPVTQGNTIVVTYLSFDYNGGPGQPNSVTITDNHGQSYARVVADPKQTTNPNGTEYDKYAFVVSNAAGGATTIHIHENFGAKFNSVMVAQFAEFSGILSPLAVDGANGQESGSGQSGQITTTNPNDIIFSTFSGASSTPPTGFNFLGTVSSPFCRDDDGNLEPFLFSWSTAWKQLTTTQTINPSWPGVNVNSGITFALRLVLTNAPPAPSNPSPVPATKPFDLLLRVYGTNVTNGSNFVVDRLEVFPTQQPVLASQFRASYANNFGSYDGITGNTGPNQDSKPIMGAAVLWDNLYCLKAGGGIYSTFDNGQTEPNQWSWSTVSNKVGTVGVHSYDYGEDWLVTADRAGLWVYGGGPVIKISQEIQPVWNMIQDWENTVVKVDIDNRRIYTFCCIPTPNIYMPQFPVNVNPQTANVCLMMNFREVDTIQNLASAKPVHQTFSGTIRAFDFARKWSYWNIAAPYASFVERNDGSTQFFICGVGNQKIYTLTDFAPVYSDDGKSINSFYTTFGFPQVEGAMGMQLGIFQLEAMYSVLTVVGSGTLNIAEFPDNPLSADANYLFPVPIEAISADSEIPVNDIGSRFFLQVGTNAPGDWFQLSKIGLTIQKSPWAPVKGGTY